MIERDDLIYLAALIDGEGCICAIQRNDSRSTRLTISIAMTHHDVVKWVHETFGGRFYEKNRDTNALNGWKQCWSWIMSDREARALLVQVLPFLKVKKRQAELGIELAELKVQGRPKHPANYPRQIEIVSMFRELNKKGPSHLAAVA